MNVERRPGTHPARWPILPGHNEEKPRMLPLFMYKVIMTNFILASSPSSYRFKPAAIHCIHTSSGAHISANSIFWSFQWTSLADRVWSSTVHCPCPGPACQPYLPLRWIYVSKVPRSLLTSVPSPLKFFLMNSKQLPKWTFKQFLPYWDEVLVSLTNLHMRSHSWRSILALVPPYHFPWSKQTQCINPAGNPPSSTIPSQYLPMVHSSCGKRTSGPNHVDWKWNNIVNKTKVICMIFVLTESCQQILQK